MFNLWIGEKMDIVIFIENCSLDSCETVSAWIYISDARRDNNDRN